MPTRRPFVVLWGSTAASNLGDGLLLAAAPLLAATLTRDPLLVAGMTVAQFAPWLLFTLPAGALVDRLDRRLVMGVGNGLRAGALLVLSVALTGDLGGRLVALYAAVFLCGLAETLVDNASLTVTARLVPRNRLEQANGTLFATQGVVNTFVGPPLGAALFAVAASLAFASAAVAFLLAAAVVILLPALRVAVDPAAPPAPMARQVAEGWTYFWGHRLLRRVALLAAAINLFGTATGSVLVLLATGPLDVGTAWFGVLLAVEAVGAVLGSLLAARAIRVLGGGPVTWAAALGPAAAYAVLGLTSSVVVAAVALFVSGAVAAANQIVVSTLRQAAVPDALLGRVTAAYRLVVLGVVPLGALLGGITGQQLGIRWPFLIAAVGLALVTVALAPRITTSALRDAEQRHVGPADTPTSSPAADSAPPGHVG